MLVELGVSHDVIMEASPVSEHQSSGVFACSSDSWRMIRTHKVALELSYSKELEADQVVVPWLIMLAAVMVSLFEIGSDWRTAYERSRDKPHPKELPMFGACVFYFPLDRARGKLEAKFFDGVYLGLRLGTNEMYIGIATSGRRDQDRARTFCLGFAERSCGCSM